MDLVQRHVPGLGRGPTPAISSRDSTCPAPAGLRRERFARPAREGACCSCAWPDDRDCCSSTNPPPGWTRWPASKSSKRWPTCLRARRSVAVLVAQHPTHRTAGRGSISFLHQGGLVASQRTRTAFLESWRRGVLPRARCPAGVGLAGNCLECARQRQHWSIDPKVRAWRRDLCRPALAAARPLNLQTRRPDGPWKTSSSPPSGREPWQG